MSIAAMEMPADYKVLVSYMREAIQSDRTTVYNALKDAAHPQLAELIRRL